MGVQVQYFVDKCSPAVQRLMDLSKEYMNGAGRLRILPRQAGM